MRAGVAVAVGLVIGLGSLPARAGLVGGDAAPSASQTLKALCAEFWTDEMRSDPLDATFNGDHRFDDRLGDLSDAAHKARHRARPGHPRGPSQDRPGVARPRRADRPRGAPVPARRQARRGALQEPPDPDHAAGGAAPQVRAKRELSSRCDRGRPGELRPEAARVSPGRRPGDRRDAPRGGREAGPPARLDGAGRPAAQDPGDEEGRGQPALGDRREAPERLGRGGPRPGRGRGPPGHQRIGLAGLRPAGRLRGAGISPRQPRERRPVGLARRRRPLCLPRPVVHHDRSDARPDPRDRPARDGENPGGDGGGPQEGRIRGRPQGILQAPQDRPPVQEHERGRDPRAATARSCRASTPSSPSSSAGSPGPTTRCG